MSSQCPTYLPSPRRRCTATSAFDDEPSSGDVRMLPSWLNGVVSPKLAQPMQQQLLGPVAPPAVDLSRQSQLRATQLSRGLERFLTNGTIGGQCREKEWTHSELTIGSLCVFGRAGYRIEHAQK